MSVGRRERWFGPGLMLRWPLVVGRRKRWLVDGVDIAMADGRWPEEVMLDFVYRMSDGRWPKEAMVAGKRSVGGWPIEAMMAG